MHWAWLHHVVRGVDWCKAGFPVIKLRLVDRLSLTTGRYSAVVASPAVSLMYTTIWIMPIHRTHVTDVAQALCECPSIENSARYVRRAPVAGGLLHELMTQPRPVCRSRNKVIA